MLGDALVGTGDADVLLHEDKDVLGLEDVVLPEGGRHSGRRGSAAGVLTRLLLPRAFPYARSSPQWMGRDSEREAVNDGEVQARHAQ